MFYNVKSRLRKSSQPKVGPTPFHPPCSSGYLIGDDNIPVEPNERGLTVIVPKIASNPFALSLSKGRSWFDRLTTNGISCDGASRERAIFILSGVCRSRHD